MEFITSEPKINNILISLSVEDFERELQTYFDEDIDEFVETTLDIETGVLGTSKSLADLIPAVFTMQMEDPNSYARLYRSKLSSYDGCTYVRYMMKNQGSRMMWAFKVNDLMMLGDIVKSNVLTPVTKKEFRAEFGYSVHSSKGPVAELPPRYLSAVMYGISTMEGFLSKEELKILETQPIHKVYLYSPLVSSNYVYERYRVSTDFGDIFMIGRRVIDLVQNI